jgi:hypothetical protein
MPGIRHSVRPLVAVLFNSFYLSVSRSPISQMSGLNDLFNKIRVCRIIRRETGTVAYQMGNKNTVTLTEQHLQLIASFCSFVITSFIQGYDPNTIFRIPSAVYNWRISTAAAPSVVVQSAQTTAASNTFTGLTPGIVYVAEVNVVGSAGPSDWSNPVPQMAV